jgi:hypothetical protein
MRLQAANYFCFYRGSLPESIAGGQPRLRRKILALKNSVKNYMSYEIAWGVLMVKESPIEISNLRPLRLLFANPNQFQKLSLSNSSPS